MARGPGPDSDGRSRRAVLGGVAAVGTALSGGCLQRARSTLSRRTASQVSLTVRAPPADEDRTATTAARTLADNLTAAGVDAEVVLQPAAELRRDVLFDHAFDCYVAPMTVGTDPDTLRPLLGSRFAGEPGWQNPFGFADLAVDDHLTAQRRRRGDRRRAAVADVQRAVARQQPFAVLGHAEEPRAVREDRFVGWGTAPLWDPLGYVGLRGVDGADRRLRVTVAADGATRNLNPLTVEYRDRGTFTGLLYDPLARRDGETVLPWLAADWDWSEDDGTVATVRLREDLRWHDGTPLTADDVAFTYRFLADTTLGNGSSPVPAPRFRGRTSLVKTATATDDRTVVIRFGDTAPPVATRAFTVPVLPVHEWSERTGEASLAGMELASGVTEALVWENPEPVGSGVVRFRRSAAGDRLVLERNDEHFLNRDPPGSLARRFGGSVAFTELVARVTPGDPTAVELVADGTADATATALAPSSVPAVGRRDDLSLLVEPSGVVYHVGFNARRAPTSDPNFRRAVARLLDKEHLASTAFDGYLTPSTVPLANPRWTPPGLAWDGADPEVPFVGTDGDLDVDAARAAFREGGYRYDDGGLMRR